MLHKTGFELFQVETSQSIGWAVAIAQSPSKYSFSRFLSLTCFIGSFLFLILFLRESMPPHTVACRRTATSTFW